MAGELIIRNTTVISGTGQAVAGTDVIIREGRFASVHPAAPEAAGAPTGAQVIDGRGKFLAPGLWESHTHLRAVLKDDPRAAQPGLDATLRDFLSRGITSVVDLGGPTEPYAIQRERAGREGPDGRAQVLFAGPSFTGIGGWPLHLHHNPSLVNQAGGAADAGALLQSHLDRRPDVIKIIYDGPPGSPEKLPQEALAAIVTGAHQRGLRVLVHVRSAQDSLDALKAGADGLEHSFLPSPGAAAEEIDQVTELLAKTGAFLTPTLAIWEQLGRAGDAAYLDELVADGCMSPDERATFHERHPGWGRQEFPHHPRIECLQRLEAAFQMLPRMHAAGVKLAAGSDIAPVLSRPGAALRELQLLKRAGVPDRDVVLAATRHAAAKVGRASDTGAVESGMTADAILLDANPLLDVDVLARPGHLLGTLRGGEFSRLG